MHGYLRKKMEAAGVEPASNKEKVSWFTEIVCFGLLAATQKQTKIL